MEEFLNKMVKGAGIEAPELCKEAFKVHFLDAVNPEWHHKKDNFEVLFQKEGIEYIADFDPEGNLVKYKMQLDKELLPVLIKTQLEEDWEIMNAVLINEGDHLIYEIIVRSSALNRSIVFVDQTGKVIEEQML